MSPDDLSLTSYKNGLRRGTHCAQTLRKREQNVKFLKSNRPQTVTNRNITQKDIRVSFMGKVGIPNFVSGPGEYIMEGEYV